MITTPAGRSTTPARIGVPLPVTVVVTGCLAAIDIWLDDGVTQATVASDVHFAFIQGVQVMAPILAAIVPVRTGTYHLWARVTGVDGETSGTGLLRTIVVSP